MRHSSLILLFLGCILAASAIWCSPEPSDPSWTTPEEILGIWETDNPNYAGRTMEVFEEALLFYTG
ncbi:MAG: hypothetical protein MUO50_20400, partial [Longimicrobiales bacterium]|nr:hypothetical protein [Longimicrobiales bacterium]